MLLTVAQRLVLALPVLLGVMTITFVATQAIPGDPLATLLPENPTPEQYEQAAREFGIDRPLPEQWLRYVVRTAGGNLGISVRTRAPVANELLPAAAATLELALVAFVLTTALGVGLGVIAAARPNTTLDHALSVFSIAGVAAPIFWIALMLQLLFYGTLNWLPAGGRLDQLTQLLDPFPRRTGLNLVDAILAGNVPALGDAMIHLTLPAIVLAYRAMGLVMRVTRTAMLEVLDAPYVQTARAFGIRERRLVSFHAFRNALPPILTVLALSFGELLTGSILVETVFNWPGIGLYTYQSIRALDYAGVIGASLLVTVIYVIANLVVDILYPLVDPRLRKR